jgi:hypothetical protein
VALLIQSAFGLAMWIGFPFASPLLFQSVSAAAVRWSIDTRAAIW